MKKKDNSTLLKTTVNGFPFEMTISKEDGYTRIKVWEGQRKTFIDPDLYIIAGEDPYNTAVKEIKEYLDRKPYMLKAEFPKEEVCLE